MGCCSVLGCKSRTTRKVPGVTFHAFPVDAEMQNKWIDATGRQNWYPNKYAKMCSIHFDTSSLIVTPRMTQLIPTAVPIKFIYNESPEKSATTGGETFSSVSNDSWVNKIETQIKIKSENDLNMQPNKKLCLIENPVSHSDRVLVKVQNMSTIQSNENAKKPALTSHQLQKTVQDIQKKLDQQKKISSNRLKKLRAVRESRRRLIKKIAELENFISDLKCKIIDKY